MLKVIKGNQHLEQHNGVNYFKRNVLLLLILKDSCTYMTVMGSVRVFYETSRCELKRRKSHYILVNTFRDERDRSHLSID